VEVVGSNPTAPTIAQKFLPVIPEQIAKCLESPKVWLADVSTPLISAKFAQPPRI
jgi:hypothetical protein